MTDGKRPSNDRPAAARRLRDERPDLTYAEIGARFGVAGSTAHRWIHPHGVARPRPSPLSIPSEVLAAADAVRELVRAIDSAAPPRPESLAAAVPSLNVVEIGTILNHLRALGWIESHTATSADLEQADAAEALARGTEPHRPLGREQRRTEELAAGCLIALGDIEHHGPSEPGS